LPLQGFDLFSRRFDLLGLPPLFLLVLLGQPFQYGRQAEQWRSESRQEIG